MKALVGPDVELRPLQATDNALFLELYCHPGTMEHMGAAMDPATATRAFQSALRQTDKKDGISQFFWCVLARDGLKPIGIMGLTRTGPCSGEVGILVSPDARGRAYAAQSLAALADHMFLDRGDEELSARHAASNTSTARLLTKLGFSRHPQEDAQAPWRWYLRPGPWALARTRWR